MSCCNPRGPSPAALLTWIGLAGFFAVVCGGPLFAILGHLTHSIGIGSLIAVGVAGAAGYGTRAALRRRTRDHVTMSGSERR